MAQAPEDPGEADLEQRILRALRAAGSPVKSVQLAKECRVPKKKLNQVLYRMQKESKVSLAGLALWRLGEGGTGEVVPAEPAQLSQARPQPDAAAIPEGPGPQLSEQQKAIYKFLEGSGPCKALIIAQALGMKTAREVNPGLYDMRKKHLLNLDEKSSVWSIYRPDCGGRNESPAIIYQQNPINMICQNGPNNFISIENSEDIQIGHGNILVRQTASGENGSVGPLHPPPMAPAGPSTQSSPATAWGPQDIRLEKSVLRRVLLGHGNEMSLRGAQAGGPAACGPSDSPPGTAGPGEVAEPEDCRRGPEEPGKDAGPLSEGAESKNESLPDPASPLNAKVSKLISQLEAVTLGSRGPRTAEDSGWADRTPDVASQREVAPQKDSQAPSERAGEPQ
ncbi:Z-DNA-binding protein 1 isoform X2 [Hyaena hyaena]|uniref:Z-DNA-binding protein 1 isoform X2 n=1 Tax=Hyaena hyaena TaxID=95912 RepID=UPI0019224847|nr:Z-DNA-binding protein 1 isoform X2 [Hyaena hyaena]